MCASALSSLMSVFGVTPPGGPAAPAPQQDVGHESDAKVKLADGDTAYDRTSGGARVGGGGRKKAKTANVPGLGL